MEYEALNDAVMMKGGAFIICSIGIERNMMSNLFAKQVYFNIYNIQKCYNFFCQGANCKNMMAKALR